MLESANQAKWKFYEGNRLMERKKVPTRCRYPPDYPVYELSFVRVSVMGLRAQVFLMIPDIGYFTEPTKLYLIDN